MRQKPGNNYTTGKMKEINTVARKYEWGECNKHFLRKLKSCFREINGRVNK